MDFKVLSYWELFIEFPVAKSWNAPPPISVLKKTMRRRRRRSSSRNRVVRMKRRMEMKMVRIAKMNLHLLVKERDVAVMFGGSLKRSQKEKEKKAGE